MIRGIGTDIIEIERIAQSMMRTTSFMQKVFTEEEYRLLEAKRFVKESVAGRFAAKEAISKALGTGFRGFALRDIEILSDELGRPIVKLHGGASTRLEVIGGQRIHLSISHCKDYAVAYATIEGSETNETCYKGADESL
ncbi:MAG: holo-ACP synthase [Cellulosilyticaceae bacterium]